MWSTLFGKMTVLLTEVFRLFDLIHILKLTTKLSQELRNVVYLELTTTPKNNASIGMSKHSYLEAVLEGIKAVTDVDVAFRPHSSDVGSQKNSSLINHTCNGRLCNVKHRVQCREATIRVSIATFLLGPKEEAVEALPEFVDSEHPRLYVPFTYEDYRKLRLSTKMIASEALELLRTPSEQDTS